MPWLLTSHFPSYSFDLRLFHIIDQRWLVIHYLSLVSKE